VQKAITYVGLDVHKDSIVVSLADATLRGEMREVREYGKILTTATALKALASKLAAKGNELRFCYEAGPCGYGVQRQLSGMGHQCAVVAPSLVPRKPGERIKTDRRDANKLARLHRAYVGLVPSEDSSGDSVRRAGITKSGNRHARRALIEGAGTYRMQARVSRKMLDRIEGLPQAIRDTAWKAQAVLRAVSPPGCQG
jgi:transposase